ncbi:hypothetical protein okayama3_28410 [Yersinia pseudotuberculosis]
MINNAPKIPINNAATTGHVDFAFKNTTLITMLINGTVVYNALEFIALVVCSEKIIQAK